MSTDRLSDSVVCTNTSGLLTSPKSLSEMRIDKVYRSSGFCNELCNRVVNLGEVDELI